MTIPTQSAVSIGSRIIQFNYIVRCKHSQKDTKHIKPEIADSGCD